MVDEGNNSGGVKRSPRMTKQNIQAMKAVSEKEQSPAVALRKMFGEFVSQLAALFSFATPGKKTNPCDVNGHVLPRTWDGDYPRCLHCNKELRSADELGSRR